MINFLAAEDNHILTNPGFPLSSKYEQRILIAGIGEKGLINTVFNLGMMYKSLLLGSM